MRHEPPDLRRQQGAATLVIALVIMTAISLLTLAVARTRLSEQRLEAAQDWQDRLFIAAESEWHDASATLIQRLPTLIWSRSTRGTGQVVQGHQQQHGDMITAASLLARDDAESPVIQIEAIARRTDGRDQSARVAQSVRLLSVLSPLAEGAPPLVLNGCLSGGSQRSAIHPLDKGISRINEALWNFQSEDCPARLDIDTHGGASLAKQSNHPLWDILFTVSRDDYAQLAAEDTRLPEAERRYWQIEPAALPAGRWSKSLGSSTQPVVMYFPRKTGCPQFAAGVRIFGFVFIDASCPDPIATARLEIYGTLAVNGPLNVGMASAQFNHIQLADPQLARLPLPFLRSVAIAGTWRDF